MGFIEKQKLKKDSHPCEWEHAFMPHAIPKRNKNRLTTDKWARWTNIKAAMEFSGDPNHSGNTYP